MTTRLITCAVLLSLAVPAYAKTVPSVDPETGLLHGRYVVTMKTTKGILHMKLDADAAPLTVTNFVTLARAGFYTGLTFHRVIPDFMIQGGDPNGNGTGEVSVFGKNFADELTGDETYERGTIAMANRGPDTNGSQFFIMHKDYQLPPAYTVFGHLFGSTRALDLIATTPRDNSDKPLTPVKITLMTVRGLDEK